MIDLEQDNFISTYELSESEGISNLIISYYYAFTTLSTCGLGDLHPVSDSERIIASFMLLFGCAIYSFVGESFSKMIHHINNFDKDYEGSEMVEQFLFLLANFNRG